MISSYFNTLAFLLNALLIFFLIQFLFLKQKKQFVPQPLVLVIIAYILSEIWVTIELDTGIRWYSLHGLCLNTFVPLIVFATALRFNLAKLRPVLMPALILSFPILLSSIIIIAVILFYGINHAAGFPWLAAFIAASLLAVTESGPIRELIKNNAMYQRVEVMLEAESLFKDVTAIALFLGLLALVQLDTGMLTSILLIHLFSNLFFGLLLGIIFGLIFIHTRKAVSFSEENFILSLFLALSVFYCANLIFEVSGVMSLVALAWTIQLSKDSEAISTSLYRIWEKLSLFSVYSIFILAGATITLSMFTEQWFAILLAIVACILARGINIYGLFNLLGKISNRLMLQTHEKQILFGSSIRSSITLALALTLPITLDYWYTVQSMAYGVVLFSLLIQLPIISSMIRNTHY